LSLYSALYAGVSGLSAQSSAMAGVADNITNINTVGYKGVQTEFRTLVTDGRSRSSYSAGGVSAAPSALVSKQGLLQASSSQTDIAIDGAGFFVTRSSTGAGGEVSFTRAGSFKPDAEGYLRNTSGLYLQGFRLDNNGNYPDNGDLNVLEPVRLSELTGTATATTKLEVRANLNSTETAYTGAYAAGDMASGTLAPQFSRSLDIYDAQGNSHRVTMGFVKRGANEWVAEIYAVPASDVTAAGGLLASGTVRFNPDGSLDRAASTPALFGSLTVSWTNGAGAEPINLNLGDDDGLNGLTQFASQSALISSIVDGGMLGNLASVEISKTGVVSAIFDDGTAKPVFQLPIATFPNPDGLVRLSGNAYGLSAQSGNVAINKPGVLGSGEIASGSLEASNVDLAQEFTNMIRFQRAYSASSKIITTVDDMLQEVSNLKR
jgi:flagellar hook protein FlgE